jgi:competence protein ComEA
MPTKMLIPFAVAASLGLAACGGGSSATATTSATPTTAASSATTAKGSVATLPATSSTAAGADAPVAGPAVSANKASKAEITAALTAAGVANADRWAGEVVEYRPYSDAAAGFPSLRKELTKYNPPAGTIDKIIASLAP